MVQNTVCNTKGLSLTNQEVCAGGEVGKGSCRGDSGGGLFLRESEHGVDGKEESPGLFLIGVKLVVWAFLMFILECQNMQTGSNKK